MPSRLALQSSLALGPGQVATRLKADDALRTKAVGVFAEFLRKNADHSKLAQQMRAEGESFSSSSPSLLAALFPKKTETVRKRAGSLRLYDSWLRSSGVCGPPFT